MNQQIYTIDEISRMVSPLAARYGVRQVRLLGSYASGCANEKSDLDFYIDRAADTPFQLLAFFADLEEMFGKDIDVVTSDGLADSLHPELTQNLRKEIAETGVAIYSEDESNGTGA